MGAFHGYGFPALARLAATKHLPYFSVCNLNTQYNINSVCHNTTYNTAYIYVLLYNFIYVRMLEVYLSSLYYNTIMIIIIIIIIVSVS